MNGGFPAFDEGDWTAVFESYDQHGGDVYYVVALRDGARFIARVDVEAYGDDWGVPRFAAGLRDALAKVAETGESNTRYTPFPPVL